MPSISSFDSQNTFKYVNNSLQSLQSQSNLLQGSPSQHSPMGTQSQIASKISQSGSGDQSTQV